MKKYLVIAVSAALAVFAAWWFFPQHAEEPVTLPAALTAYITEGTAVQLSWDGEADSRYRLYRREETDPDYHFLADPQGMAFTDDTVKPGIRYRYRVNLLTQNREYPGPQTPEIALGRIPEALTVSVGRGSEVQLVWSDTGAAAYTVYTSADGTNWQSAAETAGTALQYPNVEKAAFFAVSASYARSDGTLWESPRGNAVQLLEQPEILSVTPMGEKAAAILYTPVEGARYYEIYRGDHAGGYYQPIGISYDTAFYDTFDAPRSGYYRVRAVSDVSAGGVSHPCAMGTNPGTVFGVPVMMYHDFTVQADLDSGIAFDEYTIWAEEFEEDLQYIRDNGYTTITCQQLMDYLSGNGTMPEKPVLLTIDDGKYGVYKTAWPLLQKYGMTATLSVIGEQIDDATDNPAVRSDPAAPFCTWQELGEMAQSGAIEIISHTYYDHRYNNYGRTGADIGPEDTEAGFYRAAAEDYALMKEQQEKYVGGFVRAMAYPYSVRSVEADRVWLRAGYRLLLGGNYVNISPTDMNLFVREAGLNQTSAVLRRVARMTGTGLQVYLTDMEAGITW